MRRLAAALVSVLVLAGLVAQPAAGSGDPGPSTSFIDRRGGNPAERAALYKGKMGVLLPRSPDGLLYLQWRLINGLEVGETVGATLNTSCCDISSYGGPDDGVPGWAKATALVPGGPQASSWLPTELPGPNYTSTPNCFPDAFDTATATLKDRVARYGARNPAVLAWLQTQIAVFDACGNANAVLPAVMANAPQWLKADRAYQEAAFSLYKGHNDDAFSRFQAVARDKGSPWAPKGLYLAARTRYREAFARPSPATFAAARAAIAPLQAQPGAYGYDEVRGMLRSLAYQDHPDLLFKKLDEELNAKVPVGDLAIGLRDYLTLSGKYPAKSDVADWVNTIDDYQRDPAYPHALERWRATGKVHWLIAALALANPSEPEAASLAADAAAVAKTSPAWLTAQYHQIRLTIATDDAAKLRARVDAILASDLSHSDRNLFLALRTQLATSLADLMRFAERRPFCTQGQDSCIEAEWMTEDGTLARSGRGGHPIGIGAETKAIIDRLPLRARMTLSSGLPAEFRLDFALTNFGRAVQLQDNVAIDRLAGELAVLMPAIRADWLSIRRAAPGPAKRFAEFFVLAKIPGVSPDFAGYTRPQGTVAQWQGDWWEWMILPQPATAQIEAPAASTYRWSYWGGEDLVCYGYCGLGGFPLHMPGFTAAEQGKAQAERNRLLFYNDEDKAKLPAGSVSAWVSLLDYARAHPKDPRSPEALYWLIRITRRGHAHDRVGYQAFRLLHTRYKGSSWTARSPYYFD